MCLEVALLGHMIILFVSHGILFPTAAVPFYIPAKLHVLSFHIFANNGFSGVFKIVVIPNGCEMVGIPFTVVLVFISLVISDVERILATHMSSSLEKCLFKPFVHF